MTEFEKASDQDKLLIDNQRNNQALKKSWMQKLLVIALCAMSFYAGWQANHSHQVKKCSESGGATVIQEGIATCQWQ